MTTTVDALVTRAPFEPFEQTTIERRAAGEHDVVIDIAYSGICHSDIHQARDEWGRSSFPMVPGHEIAGIVSAVGENVTRYSVGDRVGVGCYVDSCRSCDNCVSGEEQYCRQGTVGTYNGRTYDGAPTHGGYSTQIVVDEHYVLAIPDSIALDVAAPLLCAGVTLYSPLRHWKVGPGTRLGIIGMGGLGHMGVKIAHAMGAEVVVLSQSLSKRDDGLRFGADSYFATSEPDTFVDLAETLDLIINTVSINLDINAFLGLLRVNGTLVNVGLPTEPDSYDTWTLARRRRSIAASNIGGIRETQEMLDFCAEHGIFAEVETIAASEVDEAYARVLASDVKYRFVIDISTLHGSRSSV